MALTYKELRGLTIGTTAELATHTAEMAADQAAYNTETGELFLGPGTIASKAPDTKATVVGTDLVDIYDSEDDGKKKKATLATVKTLMGA